MHLPDFSIAQLPKGSSREVVAPLHRATAALSNAAPKALSAWHVKKKIPRILNNDFKFSWKPQIAV